jgi:nicotinate-nucleotide adenylyltransferase
MERIGIFGGTFDPIHVGHLHVARRVKEKCALDRLILIPAAIPPHKHRGDMATPAQRFEMVKLAATEFKNFEVSPIEIRRQGPSYTIDTVTALTEDGDGEKALFLIMGIDAFEEIETWKSYRTLLGRISVIVISRPTESSYSKDFLQKAVESTLDIHVSTGYHFRGGQSAFVHPEFQPVHICHVDPVDISSTEIRNRIRAGLSVRGMVPASVEKYIDNRELYR